MSDQPNYLDELTDLDRENESLRTRVAELERQLDPAICRLQLPDGTVPSNAEDCAHGWKRAYEAERADREAEVTEFNAGYEHAQKGGKYEDEYQFETPHDVWRAGFAYASFRNPRRDVEAV